MEKNFDLKKYEDSCDAWRVEYHRIAKEEKDILAYETRLLELEAYIEYLELKNA